MVILLICAQLIKATYDDVLSAVGSEVGAFLTPADILLNLKHRLVTPLEILRVKGGFSSVAEAVEDFCHYNGYELSNVMHRLSDMSIDADAQNITGLLAVLDDYITGLDKSLFKFLPRGLRNRYDEYFEDIPGYQVLPLNDTHHRLLGVDLPVVAILANETSSLTRPFRFGDLTLTCFDRFAYSNIISIRCIDMSRSVAADLKNITNRLSLRPSRRIAAQLVNGSILFWRSDSLEPVVIASGQSRLEYWLNETHTIFNVTNVDGLNVLIACNTDTTQPLHVVQVPAEVTLFKFSCSYDTSCYPHKPSLDDLVVKGRFVRDEVRLNVVLTLLTSLANYPFEASHPRQVLLKQIMQLLDMRSPDGSPTRRDEAWPLIEQFIWGRPYEATALYTLIAETIMGNEEALRDPGLSANTTRGDLILPQLVN